MKDMIDPYTREKIRELCCQLLEDEIPERLSNEEGQKLIRQIKSLPIASEADERKSKYTALRLTIAKSSFRALRSRLSAQADEHQ